MTSIMEKPSLFRTAIARLSFRSRKKKEKKYDIVIEQTKKMDNPTHMTDLVSGNIEEKVVKRAYIDKNSDELYQGSTRTDSTNPQQKISLYSATSNLSRPVSQLDSALKQFKQEATQSRENLNMSRQSFPSSYNQGLVQPVMETCPPTPSTRWIQKPPPTNSYVDSEWKKLINLGKSKRNLAWKENTLLDINVSFRSSNISLDTESPSIRLEKKIVQEVTVSRAQSMNVLDISGGKMKIQIPCNQMMEMNPYQRRVKASMERLNVPSWYNPPDTPSRSPDTPNTPRWRQAGGSSSSSAGWRRHVSHSASPSTTTTLERHSTPLSSKRYRSRFSPSTSSTRSPSISSANSSISTPSKHVYLGWRSQERLDIGPVYLTSPAQRLANSVIPCSVKSVASKATTDIAKEGIKEVTEAIMDFCTSPIGDKPPQVKEAWSHVEDDSDENSDTLDDDSGIDRSDDFTQDILNEA